MQRIEPLIMEMDTVGGIPLPPCPPPIATIMPPSGSRNISSLLHGIIVNDPLMQWDKLPPPIGSSNFHNPVISANLIIQSALALVFAVIIGLRYSRVWLFGRYLHNRYLSNHLWSWCFSLYGVCTMLEANRYILNLPYYMYLQPIDSWRPGRPVPQPPSNIRMQVSRHGSRNQTEYNQIEYMHNVDTGLLLTTLVLRSLVLLFFSLALLWQIKYRCGPVPDHYKEGQRRRSPRNYYNSRRRYRWYALTAASIGSPAVDRRQRNAAQQTLRQQQDWLLSREIGGIRNDEDGIIENNNNNNNNNNNDNDYDDDDVGLISPASSGETLISNDLHGYFHHHHHHNHHHNDYNQHSDYVSLLNHQTVGDRRSTFWRVLAKLVCNQRRSDGSLVVSREKLCIAIFAISLLTLYLNLIVASDLSVYFYFGSFCLLYLPILLFSGWIVFRSPTSPSPSSTARILLWSSPNAGGAARLLGVNSADSSENNNDYNNSNYNNNTDSTVPEGPSRWSKTLLALATLFGSVLALPPNLLSRLVIGSLDRAPYYPPRDDQVISRCLPLFHQPAFSVLDLVQSVNLLVLLALFSFVRAEFHRVKQQCVWTTVGRVQDTFGIRRQYYHQSSTNPPPSSSRDNNGGGGMFSMSSE